MVLFVTLLLSASGVASPQEPSPAELQRRFAALPAAQQLTVLAKVETGLQTSTLPAMARIAELAREARAAGPLRPRTFHDPQVYAPVAPARTLVEAQGSGWAQARSDFPPVRPLRDFTPTIVYDWANGAPARVATAPTPAQRFANYCAGYHPDADAAMAAALTVLDRDGDQRELAQWCEQLYADRMGNVFAGISLYDAWYSGRTIEVPDVDAIAFARNILRTESFVSPIPDGARRDRLYEQMHAAFASHRAYRTLCEAAAGAFVTAAPSLDPTYQPLVGRMHLLWGECGYDLPRFAARLTSQDRGELLEQLDRRLQENTDAAAVAEATKTDMLELARTIRAAAAAALP